MITWAGISSDDVGVVVEHYPTLPRPARRVTAVTVPGRNGALLLDEGTYENYTQPYDIYISAEAQRIPFASRAAVDWLYAHTGYQELADSYEPDVYRLAYYAGPLDLENILNRFGRATIEFTCKPQRYLKAGRNPVAFTASGTIQNPTAYTALPSIKVTGNAAGTLTVGGALVRFLSLDGTVTLDSETQNAYSGVTNLNHTVSAPTYPALAPGENAVSWTGGITKVEITPRWWTL